MDAFWIMDHLDTKPQDALGWADEAFAFLFTPVGKQLLESVRRVQAGLQSFLSMRRIDARRTNASAFLLRFSQSLATPRQRLSNAMERSTIQRLGRTTNPLTRSERLTISTSRCGRTFASAFANCGP